MEFVWKTGLLSVPRMFFLTMCWDQLIRGQEQSDCHVLLYHYTAKQQAAWCLSKIESTRRSNAAKRSDRNELNFVQEENRSIKFKTSSRIRDTLILSAAFMSVIEDESFFNVHEFFLVKERCSNIYQPWRCISSGKRRTHISKRDWTRWATATFIIDSVFVWC